MAQHRCTRYIKTLCALILLTLGLGTVFFTSPTFESTPSSSLSNVEHSLFLLQRKLSDQSALQKDDFCDNVMPPISKDTRAQFSNSRRISINKHPHLFSLSQDKEDILCVPQKNGNRQFGALVFALQMHKIPKDGKEVVACMDHQQKFTVQRQSIGSKHRVFFVARNPYTRLLSLYLQKVKTDGCTSKGDMGCGKGYIGVNPASTFPEFVSAIAAKTQMKSKTLCSIDHHLCPQVSSCIATTENAKDVVVLKLEEQSHWFPCLLNETKVDTDILTGDAWLDFGSEQPCYYTATGNCSDMLRTIDPSKAHLVTGNVHATGASSLANIEAHYDDKSAAIVQQLYAEDFELLGYTL